MTDENRGERIRRAKEMIPVRVSLLGAKRKPMSPKELKQLKRERALNEVRGWNPDQLKVAAPELQRRQDGRRTWQHEDYVWLLRDYADLRSKGLGDERARETLVDRYKVNDPKKLQPRIREARKEVLRNELKPSAQWVLKARARPPAIPRMRG